MDWTTKPTTGQGTLDEPVPIDRARLGLDHDDLGLGICKIKASCFLDIFTPSDDDNRLKGRKSWNKLAGPRFHSDRTLERANRRHTAGAGILVLIYPKRD